jgi:hypothetical protein
MDDADKVIVITPDQIKSIGINKGDVIVEISLPADAGLMANVKFALRIPPHNAREFAAHLTRKADEAEKAPRRLN